MKKRRARKGRPPNPKSQSDATSRRADIDDPNLLAIEGLNPDLVPLLTQNDAGAQLLKRLQTRYGPTDIASDAWELSGVYLLNSGRGHEALGVLWGLYQQMLDAQSALGRRVHKGTPLVRISDCFHQLNFPVHAKRYLMLTLCEDAVEGQGNVSAEKAGVYFRLVGRGLPEHELQRYAREVFRHARKSPEDALFPEALLQELDEKWVTELPSPNEAFAYRINPRYVQYLLANLSERTGKKLELLASYLMSCMPGCRVKTRRRSHSTDYDVICAMEGIDVDFRSEFGRHFVCECKDWSNPVNYSSMAKFCRVLDSTKSRFGIVFSRLGISRAAKREQLKVFQDRGIVIIFISQADLESLAKGNNLVVLLRERYEQVRLDLPN